MYRFIIKRLLMLIPVFVGITIIVFLMLHFSPGDPARSLLGETASKEELQVVRNQLGLDKSLIVQYGIYMKKLIFSLDMGVSYISKRPVFGEILRRFPTTMLLTACGILVTLLLGIPTGIIAAVKQNTWIDKVANIIGMWGVSMPAFWLGLLMALVFSLKLRWLPATGFYGPKYWILPAITVGVNSSSLIMRMTRSSMLEVIRQDYIRTARAKGASERIVILRHALKNCLIPIITLVGLQIGMQLGGAVVTETIFSIPGLGKFMVDSIATRDYPVIQGGVLFIAVVFGLVNLLVDILYAYADPRIKSQYAGKRKRPQQKEARQAILKEISK